MRKKSKLTFIFHWESRPLSNFYEASKEGIREQNLEYHYIKSYEGPLVKTEGAIIRKGERESEAAEK